MALLYTLRRAEEPSGSIDFTARTNPLTSATLGDWHCVPQVFLPVPFGGFDLVDQVRHRRSRAGSARRPWVASHEGGAAHMTSAGGELSISPDKIKTHATNVTSAGSGLTEALEAAQAVSAPSDAFGKLCAFLGPLFVDAVETDGIDAIQAAIDAFGDTSSNLTAVADAFTTRDTTNAAALKSQESGL
ncbi:type VII secretion target [Nocardia salmonicida]|uniref:type VII secretion target n=1 Tax=Nocardia salmonicida TaxID=53431 RepID=UPI0037B5A60D